MKICPNEWLFWRAGYFEGARFISEVFSSWFDDMFEKIWILLKFWPFSATAARLVTGAKIAISASPAPLFLGFWWVMHPSDALRDGLIRDVASENRAREVGMVLPCPRNSVLLFVHVSAYGLSSSQSLRVPEE